MIKWIFLLLLFVSGIFADYVTLTEKIIKKCNKKFERDFGIYLMGSGGAMMEEIETLHVLYFSNQKLNVDEARKLILKTSGYLIHAMNQEQRLRPHIKNFPFSPQHLKSFGIGFVNEKGECMGLPYVSLVNVTKGNIKYSFFDHHFIDEKDINESYEEAMEKVR